jgi:hypothetical protein
VIKRPAQGSPNTSRAPAPLRDQRTTNPVPQLVTAPHTHAPLSPWR